MHRHLKNINGCLTNPALSCGLPAAASPERVVRRGPGMASRSRSTDVESQKTKKRVPGALKELTLWPM